MSLRWSSYVAPPKGGGSSKTQNGQFSSKIALAWRKSATKFLCVKTVSGKVVRHSLAYVCKNYWWGTTSCTWNFGSYWPRWSEIADFRSLFARSDSAVTPSEKKLNNKTLIGSPLRAFKWAQDEHRTLSLSPPPPKGDSKQHV